MTNETRIPPLAEIDCLDSYLRAYGRTLAGKAITSLNPLHVPGKSPLPDFDGFLRTPFEPQQHVVAAATEMLRAENAGFIVGEMGCGKTLLGMLAVHKHANGKPYRAIALCPDHLIAVWEEELEATIPGAIIRTFDKWRDILAFLDKGSAYTKEVRGRDVGTVVQHRRRWAKPQGAEWYILGRNQAKWYPDEWKSIADPYRGFDGLPDGQPHSVRNIVVDTVTATDEHGRTLCDKNGFPRKRKITARVYCCPSCGSVPRDNKGVPLDAKALDKQLKCEGFYCDEVPDEANKKSSGLDRIAYPGSAQQVSEGKKFTSKSSSLQYIVRKCGEPLWGWSNKSRRWPPARIVQRKLKRFFDYLIVDEVHEQKSDESAQSMACGKLMAATKKTLALTGTLIGGYAKDLFPLMARMFPQAIKDDGFAWGQDLQFSQVYGRVDRIVTTKQDAGEVEFGKRTRSMRRARTGKRDERYKVQAGIMPSLFGRHMIGNSVFITLEEMADELPDFDEYVEEGACDMDEEQAAEYRRVEQVLDSANKELLKSGSMKLLGVTLQTLLAYPDMPYGWVSEHPGHDAVGYYIKPKIKTTENYVGVVQPADLDREAVRPKEQKLIDICKAEKAAGRQVWVYVQMTGIRDIQPRLKMLLEREGLKVKILRSKAVDTKARKDWIDKNAPDCDVMISHPKPVSTGLTLFSKRPGGHNFPTLVFYETGYSLFDMRQAARRSWRIGQPLPCKVYYLYYKGTMQHRAMQLMSRKMAAATALEGEFSTEGLVALAGDDNAQMALARNLSENMDQMDMQRCWSKVKSVPKKDKPKLDRPLDKVRELTPAPVAADALDRLPDEVQLVAQTMLDNQPAAARFDEGERVAWTDSRGTKRTAVARFIDCNGDACVAEDAIRSAAGVPVGKVSRVEPAKLRPVAPPPPPVIPMPEPVVKPVAPTEPDDDDAADAVLPMLTREQLARMFQNLMDNGMTVEDFLS